MDISSHGQIEMVRINYDQNVRRFYYVVTSVDLFGTQGIIRAWGRIGRPGRMRFEPHTDAGSAMTEISTSRRRKSSRGYIDRG